MTGHFIEICKRPLHPSSAFLKQLLVVDGTTKHSIDVFHSAEVAAAFGECPPWAKTAPDVTGGSQVGCEFRWYQSGHPKKVDASGKVDIHGGLVVFRFRESPPSLALGLLNDSCCCEWKMSACFGAGKYYRSAICRHQIG